MYCQLFHYEALITKKCHQRPSTQSVCPCKTLPNVKSNQVTRKFKTTINTALFCNLFPIVCAFWHSIFSLSVNVYFKNWLSCGQVIFINKIFSITFVKVVVDAATTSSLVKIWVNNSALLPDQNCHLTRILAFSLL